MNRNLLIPCGLAIAVLCIGCQGPQGRLNSLAEKRLSYAPDVAWYKHSRQLPVYDPDRETAILRSVMTAGSSQGLDPQMVRRFFAAEMEASRRIQWAWIEGWRKNALPPPDRPTQDLGAYIRPRLDEINEQQLRALAHGAEPLTLAQLSEIGERFLPKN